MNTAIERFACYLRRRYGDRSTPKHYLSDLRLWVQVVGCKSPQEITVHDIDRFVDQQLAQGLRPTTINRRLATLHTFFEFLAAEVPDQPWPNPVVWRRHRVQAGRRLPRDLPDAAVDRLFAVIHDVRDRAIFGLMIGAGLRVGEITALTLADLVAPPNAAALAPLRVRGKGQKERRVWLTPTLYATVQAWLTTRPASATAHLFLNHHGQPLTVAGIQYRLRHYAAQAGVPVTCHQLRHTFARRLAEQELPLESLAQLLGHAQVTTTQLYTAGADPQLRQAFATAMAQWETTPAVPADAVSAPSSTVAARPAPTSADPAVLADCLAVFDPLPAWLRPALQAYLTWRWLRWQPHLAAPHARRLARQLRRIWDSLLGQQPLMAWSDLQRSHLEAWLSARQAAGLAATTQATELTTLLGFLRFVVEHEATPLNPNLFRVPYPARPAPLPRHLTEAEYHRLAQVVLADTAAATPTAARDRAWFFTLAHTGVRVSELLNLRLGDLDLASGRLLIRAGKHARDRVVYLTPTLTQALRLHLAHRDATTTDDHLWLDESGHPLRDHQVRHRLRRWGQQCDVAVTPHRLRHTWATRLLNQGLALPAVSKLLGHQDLRMTQRYARLYDATVCEQFQAAMTALENQALSAWLQQVLEPVEQPIMQIVQVLEKSVNSV